VIIQSAAPADYRPEQAAPQKLKKQGDGSLTLRLVATPDVAKAVGERKQPGQTLVGFAAETEGLTENALKKLEAKNLDMIVANNLKVEGAGFAGDTNVVTIITAEETRRLPVMSKEEVAMQILDTLLEMDEG
jgi:phosphopantothenoylcysteine decarboxylase/phosphopantothenate--cysteine ligase